MMPRTDYRNRAAQVRRSARAHLAEIRAARIARKSELVQPTVADDDLELAEEAAVEDASDDLCATPAAGEVVEPIEEACPLEDIESAALAELAEEAETADEPVEVTEPADQPSIEATADPALPDVDGSVEEPEPAVMEESGPAKDADQTSSDLNSLPGAGPGLVWLLHECGVTSLTDLAQCTPEELGPKLGVVGQILNVTTWIDFAREQTAE